MNMIKTRNSSLHDKIKDGFVTEYDFCSQLNKREILRFFYRGLL